MSNYQISYTIFYNFLLVIEHTQRQFTGKSAAALCDVEPDLLLKVEK